MRKLNQGISFPKDQTPNSVRKVRDLGSSRFALRLFEAVHRPGENLVFSPYGLRTALSLLWLGARGTTRAELAEVLHLNDADTAPGEIYEDKGRPLGYGPKKHDWGDELLNVSSLWCDPSFSLRPDYVLQVQQEYAAEAKVAGANCAANMVDWIQEKTQGKIHMSIVTPTEVDPMVILNAVYFRGLWQDDFAERFTKEAEFFLYGGKRRTVQRMLQTEYFEYREREGTQIVDLPYKERMRMRIVLPPKGVEFGQFCRELSGAHATYLMEELERSRVTLSLPRFRVESSLIANDALERLGSRRVFDPREADFTGMTGRKPFFAGKILHSGFVRVDEEGTEAAAVTEMLLCGAALHQEKPVEMVVDRPFVFTIWDGNIGTVIFLGAVADPGDGR